MENLALKMIKVYVINGKAFVWNAEDVYLLRTKHHVVGSLVGCFPRQTFQNSQMWLPLQLLPEEATLLVEKGIAQLVTSSKVGKAADPDNVEYFFKFREDLCMQQIDLHKEIRQKTILEKADIIYEGKKRKVIEKLQGKVFQKKKRKSKVNESFKQITCQSSCSINARSHDISSRTNENADESMITEDNFCFIRNSASKTSGECSSNVNQVCASESLTEADTEKNCNVISSNSFENSPEIVMVKESQEISEIKDECITVVAEVTNKKHNSNIKVSDFEEINEKNIHDVKSHLLSQGSSYEAGQSDECVLVENEVYVVKNTTTHTVNEENINKNENMKRKVGLHKEFDQKTVLEKTDIICERKKKKVKGKVSQIKRKKKVNQKSHSSRSHDICRKTNESADENEINDEDSFCIITNSVLNTNNEHNNNSSHICSSQNLANTGNTCKIKSFTSCEASPEVVMMKESQETSEIKNECIAVATEITNKSHSCDVKVTSSEKTSKVSETTSMSGENINEFENGLLHQNFHTEKFDSINDKQCIERKQFHRHSEENIVIEGEINENIHTDENISLQPCSSTVIDIPEIDRDAIIAEEMKKIPNLKKETCMVQLFTECPWKTEKDNKIALWNFPQTEQEKLKYAVFKDLWEKGYYLTAGTKFGGDFLAYAGDPVKYHALYIVVCIPFKQDFQAIDLVLLGRLGNQVKKTVTLASVTTGGIVEYVSLRWASEIS